MAKVDFYIVGEPGDGAQMRIGARVVEKAWQQGHGVYVLTADAAASAAFDDLLWTFRQNSFVPHACRRADASEDPTGAPVLIGEHDSLPAGARVLVNLSERVPECAARCERIAEIVAGDETARIRARARFRSYRELGAELDTHEV